MSGGERTSFSSVEEELQYWKDQAAHLRQDLEDLRAEFDDFQENSRDLEAELETSLEQTEAKNRELLAKVQRLQDENDQMKSRLETQTAENYVTISNLQAENADLMQIKESYMKYTRELEQLNDDLERGKRVTMTSLDDFETKLNMALERNAILENELDEKDELSVACQRLKDEVRDLRSELDIQTKVVAPDNSEGSPLSRLKASHPSTMSVGMTTSPITKKNTPMATPTRGNVPQPQPITPSARISALNMVGDLLRKVGTLETRLASCRTNLSKDTIKHNRSLSPASGSPRSKRLHVQKLNGDAPAGNNVTGGQVPPVSHLTKITV
ncbi:PREDICTED: nuclear distribution protein nudE-like 1-B [Amphimedon queenslandica]|uniref:NUDE domain-containing protein n=1 Tax=Amphimedon queenslandica TaxID=400682 RepID=A0A1X7VVI5_AMPQE|nr:PREDICTED: nuclear distribution protein nudE-like 1-B [Amphimedon queenslandica]|eukprot:XP_003382876.1 PREDICTED: nuclear distribution protein nudE-like 1-B [Amphimedon queenslandica]